VRKLPSRARDFDLPESENQLIAGKAAHLSRLTLSPCPCSLNLLAQLYHAGSGGLTNAGVRVTGPLRPVTLTARWYSLLSYVISAVNIVRMDTQRFSSVECLRSEPAVNKG